MLALTTDSTDSEVDTELVWATAFEKLKFLSDTFCYPYIDLVAAKRSLKEIILFEIKKTSLSLLRVLNWPEDVYFLYDHYY